MMSQRKTPALLFFLFIFLSSACENFWEPRSVVTNLPEHQPLLVINSFINPDSVFKVSVAKSRAFLALPEYPFITDATVTIFESGNSVAELFHAHDGFYRAINHKPEIGATYELRVSAEGFMVTATAAIPSPIKIDSIAVKEATIDRLTETKLTLYFQDPPGEDNYYQLLLFRLRSFTEIDTVLSNYGFASSDAVLRKPDDFEDKSYYYDDAYFDDALFDGDFYDLDISFYKISEPRKFFVVVLLTTSESYYNFRKSVEQQNATEDNPFAEPVPVYTNIENGLGVFSGYSSFIYSLR